MGISNLAVVLHSSIPEGASKDEQDVLRQASAVAASLSRLGYEAVQMPFSLDGPLDGDALNHLTDSRLADELLSLRPRLVFNLVETVGSSGMWSYLAPALLERLGIAYTGSPPGAIFLSTHKIAAKMLLRRKGIATPGWVTVEGQDQFREGRYIVKALYEDASVGMGQQSVVRFELRDDVVSHLMRVSRETGIEHFAEEYIDGREFSIALIGDSRQPRVLAPAETRFHGYLEANKHRIVDYSAKWETGSFEYQNTRTVHRFSPEDSALLREMTGIARACWAHFGLGGYARVDFRVDEAGTPWVLEINANPCITPEDSGYINAASVSALTFDDVVRQIASEALDEGTQPVAEGRIVL
jgi:D-alanine-D-alanine ligase